MKVKIAIWVMVGIKLIILWGLMFVLDDEQPDFTENAKWKKLSIEREIESSRRMEETLLRIKEIPAGEPTAIESLIASDIEIIGEWGEPAFMVNSSLSIKAEDSSRLRIQFHTEGCLDSWSLCRTGSYYDGALVLDWPVAEYFPRVYKKLYTVKIGNNDFLVPDILAQNFKKCLSDDGKTIIDTIGVNFCAFKRTK